MRKDLWTYRYYTHAIFALLVVCVVLSGQCYAQGGWTIRGNVAETGSGKPLGNVSVVSKISKAATMTDSTGHFTLALRAGEQLVTFSSVGYFPKTITISYRDTFSELDIQLPPETRELKELLVKDRAPDENVRSSQMGVTRLDIRNLKNMPVVFGETDILKAITLQTGVATVGEGTPGFNVRGGRTDQNLVLLDGAPLFNTSHLLGFLSNVNADAIRDVTLYKGDIPAAYGGRLSSLLNINTRHGNKERVNVSTGVGLMTASIMADGPVTKDKKLTFLAGGRVAYPNLLIRSFPQPTNQNRAFFFDLNGRLSYEFSPRSIVSLSAYHSRDRFKFPEDTLYGWRSTTATLNWNRQLNKVFSFAIGGNWSGYEFNLKGLAPTYEYMFRSGIRQSDARGHILWEPSPMHKIEAGLVSTWYSLTPGSLRPDGKSNITTINLEKERAWEQAAYVSEEWAPTHWFAVTAGLRYVNFRNIGPGTVFQYDPRVPRSVESIVDTVHYGRGGQITRFGGFEPRLSIKINTGRANSVKLSYTRTRQYLHLISNTTAISPVDFWKLADDFVPPQVATQWAVGYFKNMLDNMLEIGVELYRKDMVNLVEYQNGATLLLNPAIETDLVPAKGKAYGVELNVQKTRGILTGQVSYTYSRTFARVVTGFATEQINRGEWFPSIVDRPNNLAISTQWKWKKGWTFGTNFVYNSGRPVTYPDGTYRLNDVIVQDYSGRNLDRIPDYHRADISFTKDTRQTVEQRRYSIWSFSIYNLYARKNPYSIYFKQSGSRLVSYRLSVFGTIIPSINWKFNF